MFVQQMVMHYLVWDGGFDVPFVFSDFSDILYLDRVHMIEWSSETDPRIILFIGV